MKTADMNVCLLGWVLTLICGQAAALEVSPASMDEQTPAVKSPAKGARELIAGIRNDKQGLAALITGMGALANELAKTAPETSKLLLEAVREAGRPDRNAITTWPAISIAALPRWARTDDGWRVLKTGHRSG